MSYSTISEANEYVSTHYVASDPLRVAWEAKSDEDKQALLNKSYLIINYLPLRGYKTSTEQLGAFPRNGDTEVPLVVKYAEVELALAYTDDEVVLATKEYQQKAAYGIQSYRVGNFSETLLEYSGSSYAMKYGLASTEAERLLSPWLSGGFCIE